MEIRRIGEALVFLCLASSGAIAQRGMGGRGMGMGRGRGAGDMTRESAIVIPKFVNAVNLLIAHRQDLALSDTQFVQVIAMKRALDSTNAPLMRKLDSVQRLFKGGAPLFGDPSTGRRDSLATARELVQETIGNVRENVSVGRDKAYALLSYPQRTKAQEFEDKAEKAIADESQHGRGKGGDGAFGRPPTS
jgi:hypothetical protein